MSTDERAGDNAGALVALDELTRRLRRECPWDREQDERTIVPHTVEEAYELADAVHSGDDAKLLDELGDVLFQLHFLSLLLEERGGGSLEDVAEHVRNKLIRRHPHVFGPVEVADAGHLLFSVVNVARKLKVDPEISLRASSGRFRGRVEDAHQLAAQAGVAWHDASPDTKLHFYAQARFNEAP